MGRCVVSFGPAWIGDGHAEAAGRLRTEATFLLFCALAVAAVVYSIVILRGLPAAVVKRVVAAFGMTMIAGIALAVSLGLDQGDPHLERSFAHASLGLLKAPQPAPPAALAKAAPPPRVELERADCSYSSVPREPQPLCARLFDFPPERFPGDGFPMLRIM